MKKPMSLRLGALLIVAVATLSGCYLPEKFSAKINIERDQSYSFVYSGTVLHAPFMMDEDGTKLTEKAHQAIAADAERIAKQPGVKKAKYIGNARIDLQFEERRSAGQRLKVFDLFFVSSDKGVLTVSSAEVNAKNATAFAKAGLELDGTLEISLPKNAQVIRHNATSTPIFGFGSYSWKIRDLKQLPAMQVKFLD